MESAKKEKGEATWLRAKKDEDDRRLRLSSQCVFRHSKGSDRAFLRVVATIRENDYGSWVPQYPAGSCSGHEIALETACGAAGSARRAAWT